MGIARNFNDRDIAAHHEWHENLGTAFHSDGVLFENFILDEERYWSNTAGVDEKRVDEALSAFMSLKSETSHDAIRYITEFGEFDHIEIAETGFAYPKVPPDIQRFWHECEYPGRGSQHQDPFVLPLDEFWSVRKDVLDLNRFAAALSAKDPEQIRLECEQRRPQAR